MGDKGLFNTASSKLSLFWESFLKTDSNSHERGAWLDLFLAEALIQLQDGVSVSDIVSLTSSNIAAILASETVSEIEKICSEPSDGEELGPLRSHLLSGRGWRCIALLHALGLQDVAAGANELAGLLISIYSIVDGKGNKQKNPYIVEKSLPAIEQVCCFRIPNRSKNRSFSHSSGIEGSPPSSRKISTTSNHSKRLLTRQEKLRDTSDSEAIDHETHKSVSLKIRLDPMDFDYFTSVIRSEDEEKKNSSSYKPGAQKKKLKKLVPRDFSDDRIQKVFSEEVNVLQFRRLVVELLCGLCQGDTVSANVFVQAFNFSLDQLGVLQFSSVNSNEAHHAELKYAMTRLFLSALDKVILQQESMSKVIQKGALRMMLRLLEPQFNKEDCALSQDFIFGVTYALINFMHSILIQHSSLDKSAVFLEHFQQFASCYNNRIIDKTVYSILKSKSIDEKVALNRVKKIIGLLSQLILSMKQVRTKFVHLKSCKKQKHKNCNYPTVSHHHDNIFGKVYANTILSSASVNEASCSVTSMFMIFTRFLCEDMGRDITIRTMQAMMTCGTCCCFPASILISRILKVVQHAETTVRNLGLDLLERTIYREVGAIDLVTMCKVCVNIEEKDKCLTELTTHRWACLKAFQDMLLSPHYKISYSVGSHLMRVTPRCSIQVQREMFFGVFFPVFISAKKNYLNEKLEKDKFALVMCLSVFSNLLSRVRFAEKFININAVVHILDLIDDRNFTEVCCSILEIIIIVLVWKMEKKDVFEITNDSITELSSLKDFVLKSTNEFLTLLKKIETNTKKEEYNELMFQDDEEWSLYMRILERLNLFWKTWMNLSLYCPQIRLYFQRYLSIHCFTLISFFLQYLSKAVSINDFNNEDYVTDKLFSMYQLNLKLLESLMILNIVAPYAGNPGGMSGLKDKLEKVVEGSLGLRAVCDVLIKSAGAYASTRTMIPTYQMPKLDMFELGLSTALEDGHSESSLDYSADEGYDADVDAPCRKIQEKENSLKGSLPPSRRVSAVHGDRRYTQITHSELCHIALHLIVYCHRDRKWQKEAIYSLHRISSILRDNQENCLILSKTGFTLKLLTEFSDLLSKDIPEKYELQQAVLEVFGYLARHSVQPKELATYIKFFISEDPPLKLILPCLIKMLNATPLHPKYTLNFPREYSNANLVTTTAAHKLGVLLHQQHVSLGVTSCWSRAAMFLPLNAELGWAMWVQGFSLSLWLRITPATQADVIMKSEYSGDSSSESGRSSRLDDINVDHLLHIISIGYEALVLEFWADGSKELLHIRLTRPDGTKFEVLSEASLEGRLPPLTWHHLAISVHDSVHSGKVIIEVTLIIDGWCEVQVPLSFKGILVRKSRSTLVAVGDTGSKIGGKWDLGGLLMFRKPVLKKTNAILLTALGPDITTITQARVGNTEPLWSNVFSSKTLTAGVPWTKLLDNPSTIKEFQDSMLLGYHPKNPELINIYPLASATLGLGPGFRVITVEQRSSQLVPMSVNVLPLCKPTNSKHSSISTAVDSLGGVTVFLFLFARVVELRGTEMEQGQALELYLRLSHLDPYLYTQAENYLPLVSSVLQASIASRSGWILKAILDTCCDKPGFITVWGEELSVNTEGDYLLTDPECLVSLLLSSSLSWSPATMLLFLKALLSLLRDDHPHREFNASQLNRAHSLDAILFFCKENLFEERNTLDEEVCNSLVEVTRGLMTAPPQLSHVTAIADYLLLAHPAHATYISHARSSLYFILPPRPPPRSRWKLSKNLSLFGGVVDAKEYSNLYAQPVDAKKLNKALHNLQIKQKTDTVVQKEISECSEVICDSGIAGSLQGNPAGSTSTRDCDFSSNNSANTYFLKMSTEEDLDCTTGETSSNTTDDDEKFVNDNIVEVDSKSEDAIKTGLLELLHDQILVMPDNIAHTALPNVLSPEAFIVMANHSNLSVVTAVVKVLGAYLDRASSEEKARFVKDKGFYLLAMQLSRVTPTPELADALASIVTMCHCNSLNLQTDGDSIEFTLPAISPLLSLLPRTVTDIPLAHNIIVFVHNVFLKISDWKNLLEFGLIEVLLKSLVSLMHQSNNALSDLCIPERNILVSDINSFLSAIAVHSIQTSGHHNIQVTERCDEMKELNLKSSLASRNSLMRTRCGRLSLSPHLTTHQHQYVESYIEILNELILQIEYVHGMEISCCGAGSDCSEAVKYSHCFILQSAMKAVTETINSHTSKPSFFSSEETLCDESVVTNYLLLVSDSDNSNDSSNSSSPHVCANRSVISMSSDDLESHNSSSTNLNTIGKLSKSDLVERFRTVITKATEFAVYTEPVNEDSLLLSPEMKRVGDFVKEIWNFLLMSLVTVIERKSMSTRTTWSNTVWANRDILRTLGSQMFLWLLSPNHSKKMKMFTISSILNEPRSKDILTFILNTSQLERILAYYLWDLRFGGQTLDSQDKRILDEFASKLEEWCSSAVFAMITGEVEAKEEALEAVIEAVSTRDTWRHQRDSQVHKVVYRHESLAKEISEKAMAVTKEVEENKSHHLKMLMESIKNGFGAKVQAVFKWREVISMLTHEQAVWHFSESFPMSWELDPTEGPFRVRNRLRRCTLDHMNEKYFRQDNVHHRRTNGKKPLGFLFEGTVSSSTFLIDRLHLNAKIHHMCKAHIITPDRPVPGELLIGHCSLYFVPSCNDNTKEWAFDQIKELHRRRFELQERGLEIFLLNGKTFFMAFESTKERDDFMNALLDCELCNRVACEPLGDAVELWREGLLTNWQYLTILNTLAGRTYNDLMQYPILPFILADYVSEVLDLENSKSFRNLMKPMAIQEQKNEQHYINHYNDLKTAEMNHNNEPYHYSSHYSNSGIVLHFLVRLPPYTEAFLSYQDNNFDCPDRTFHSLHTTWRLTSCESATDVKELIPEFFFLPEFLCNHEQFDFGTRQSGEIVDDIVLPPWAANPRLFILIHRQALESWHVREFLPHWIDLVFGYKQVGKAAVDSINVFHPATYSGFDPESIEDPLLRKAWQTMVQMYGQTPKQLFRGPHPMVVLSHEPKKNVPQVLPSVKGLNWGNYVGSPSEGQPSVIWQGTHHTPISTLVALLSNDVFGLAPYTTLLLAYIKESSLSLVVNGGTSVLGAALISWGHADGIVRAKLRKEQIPFPAIANMTGDPISLCTSVPDSNQLWVAYESGKILVYSYKFDGAGGSLDFDENWTLLSGHKAAVNGIALSRGFSLAVSIDSEGLGILWDMNSLTYVRSLPKKLDKLSLVAISETLGDIATVSEDGEVLSLYNINCVPVGSVTSDEKITALTFSCAPEGRSVNVIACGMADGSVRLWSTWDLTFVKKITAYGLQHPILCLAYSHDSQHLYASSVQGHVVIWQGSNIKTYSKTPRFLNLTSLL